ncbi:MAG TPA: D-aminoacyl-tRNA deacylase [Bryobacteraceae bacterium]|jgi:D-tyrosyl-tRNA(Tyr) deacylase|nr:D-aminoacyl-tRNA deacylase [Bryobacteraceae bacterium]
MRALVQRVSSASVTVDGAVAGQIGPGLCIFLGIKDDDTPAEASKLAEKVAQLRIFPDEQGKMNRSLLDVGGGALVISQFTLYGDTRGGNRPSYSKAARPEHARQLYELFIARCRKLCPQVETGVFQAHMEVNLTNDGPVTLMCYAGE